MERRDVGLVKREQKTRIHDLQDLALGLVSTQSFPAIVGCADMMLKSAGVILVGFEKIGGGHCTAVVRGKTADVRLAVEAGAETAEKFGQVVSKLVIPRPLANLEAILPIGARLMDLAQGNQGRPSHQAIGLLETRGFPALVGAADAMLKSADVDLTGYEKIGDGLCTVIIRGTVANVVVAVEAGMFEAERIGELTSVMVIPRPLDDLERALPLASCFVETVQPLQMPVVIEEKQPELLALPELEKLSKPEEVEAQPQELPELQELQELEELQELPKLELENQDQE
ncbi:BMC domain-containing protein [Phormidium pseudopriestleyi FRX01]|uniref:BMC domain-containing protein n=1 Tax=Phormidium pseudopriestleyi FRX01 TaxID=1759528 RepID=A0ABS3FSS6_9CYAN|nr:BMC domain-containing protein [Phormidium pseudopriestleyi]MBO0349661.1 BMC domain-containing protein [Phormidium pseudopriestleyi FRX01]